MNAVTLSKETLLDMERVNAVHQYCLRIPSLPHREKESRHQAIHLAQQNRSCLGIDGRPLC